MNKDQIDQVVNAQVRFLNQQLIKDTIDRCTYNEEVQFLNNWEVANRKAISTDTNSVENV